MSEKGNVSLEITNPGDYLIISRKEFNKSFHELNAKLAETRPLELLSKKETADKLGINLSTLWRISKNGFLKSHGLAGTNRVLNKLEDIEDALVELKTR